ncbi:MAG: hypothetical protein GY751_15700 [Bacteroidetes bacterium]|nr:hypothetical protein [Bacteroidota bacterium]
MKTATTILTSKSAVRIIRAACFLTLAAYALKHFMWDGRLLAQIYAETFIDGSMRLMGLEWKGFFLKDAMNMRYRTFVLFIGTVFSMGAAFSFTRIPVQRRLIRPVVKVLFLFCTGFILLSAISSFIKSQLHLNMLLEYSIQIMVVLMFLWQAMNSRDARPPVLMIKWALAFTFTGHGLYALNIIPIPGNFLMMTSNILHTGRTGTLGFLMIAGVLDVLCSILIFNKKTEKYALAYMVFWGFVTALARLVAYHGTASTPTYIAMWLPEFLIRSGHYLLPLYVLILQKTVIGQKIRSNTRLVNE